MFNTSFPGSDHQTMFGWISYTILFSSRGIYHTEMRRWGYSWERRVNRLL